MTYLTFMILACGVAPLVAWFSLSLWSVRDELKQLRSELHDLTALRSWQ